MSIKPILTIILFFSLFTSHYSLFPSEAEAEVVIKIRAVNPLDEKATTTIKSYLPKGVMPEDIIDSGNFLVTFDKDKGACFIEQEVMLNPKETMVFEIAVQDVWVIPEERIDLLRREAEEVISGQWIVDSEKRKAKSEKLTTNHYSLATELKEEILKNLDRIVQRQAENTVSLVGVERHIEAYEENVKALEQAEADIQVLKNLITSK